MSRHHSLKDLRTEISIELRNESGSNERYTDSELNVAIRRATAILSEYFWFTETDSSKTFTTNTFDYVYDYPVKDIEKVGIISASAPVKFSEKWYESVEGTLTFLSNEDSGATIRVWYKRHPVPFPNDLATSGAHTDDTTSILVASSSSLVDWPDTGYCKIDNEVLRYTALNRSTNTFTVVRAQLSSAADAITTGTAVSFVNRVDKDVFFEGVKDLAIAYLSRMRIVDAPSADVDGHVTIMREILEAQGRWVRQHRMRSQRQTFSAPNTSQGLRSRSRGR